VANGRHRFALPEEVADEFERLVVRTQRIGIHQSARDQERIELLGLYVFQRKIHVDRRSFVRVIHPLDLSRFDRDHAGLCARVIERFSWLGQLHFLESVRRKDRHFFSR
jgi:hypothetical protein